MDTKSRLMTLDMWLSEGFEEVHLLSVDHFIKEHFTVLDSLEHEYTPYGLTKVYILSESHCIVHVYPEHNFLSLDLFVCNPEVDLCKMNKGLLSVLPIDRFKTQIIERG